MVYKRKRVQLGFIEFGEISKNNHMKLSGIVC